MPTTSDKLKEYAELIDSRKKEIQKHHNEVAESHNPQQDGIAFFVREIKLLKSVDLLQKINEVYFTLTLVYQDQNGEIIKVVIPDDELIVYNIKKNEPLEFQRPVPLFRGFIGNFLHAQLDFYESDKKSRKFYGDSSELLSDPKFQKLSAEAAQASGSTEAIIAVQLVTFVGNFIAGKLASNKDKHLGTFPISLDKANQYSLRDPIWTETNPYLEVELEVQSIPAADILSGPRPLKSKVIRKIRNQR